VRLDGGWCSRDVLVMDAGGKLSESESEPATIISHSGFLCKGNVQEQQSQGSLEQRSGEKSLLLSCHCCDSDFEWPLVLLLLRLQI